MENEKKNNGTLVGILIGLVIALLVGVCLFATGTIGFKMNTTSDNGQANENSSNESSNKLTESEALDILKNRVDFAEEYFTTYANPCGEGAEIDYSIKHPESRAYYQSKEYSSFNELNESLLKYMSQEIINLRSLYKKEYYLEQNGKLYCDSLAGGSMVTYQSEKTEYTINEILDNKITANIVSYIESGDSNMTEYDEKRNISVELTKNGNNWQITKYDGDKIDFFDR